MTTPDYSKILFSPEDIGNRGARYLEERRANKGQGVTTALQPLDEIMYPLYPGELMSIIARPGNGKTGFMMRWARTRAAWLREQKLSRVVVYVTLEQSIEELNAFNLAAENRLNITNLARGEITDTEWNACLRGAVNRRFQPLWNVGYSATVEGKQPLITVEAIAAALALIKEPIDVVFIDYLQRLPMPRGAESKTVGVSENLDTIKTTIAQQLKAPVVLGVQARREVDDHDPEIPGLDDGQWTSNIEQSSDRVISLVRPVNYKQVGEAFGKTTVTGPNMLLVSVLKQKLGPANKVVWLMFQPEYNKLDKLEIENVPQSKSKYA